MNNTHTKIKLIFINSNLSYENNPLKHTQVKKTCKILALRGYFYAKY